MGMNELTIQVGDGFLSTASATPSKGSYSTPPTETEGPSISWTVAQTNGWTGTLSSIAYSEAPAIRSSSA